MGSSASPESRWRSSGVAIALLISSFSFFMISGGIFAGPTIAYHCTPSKPLIAQLLEGRRVGKQRMALQSRHRDRLHLAAP